MLTSSHFSSLGYTCMDQALHWNHEMNFMAFMSVVSICSDLLNHCHDHASIVYVARLVLPVSSLPLMIHIHKPKVSCHACFNFSCLCCRSPTLHSGNSPSPTSQFHKIFLSEPKLTCWMQAVSVCVFVCHTTYLLNNNSLVVKNLCMCISRRSQPSSQRKSKGVVDMEPSCSWSETLGVIDMAPSCSQSNPWRTPQTTGKKRKHRIELDRVCHATQIYHFIKSISDRRFPSISYTLICIG